MVGYSTSLYNNSSNGGEKYIGNYAYFKLLIHTQIAQDTQSNGQFNT